MSNSIGIFLKTKNHFSCIREVAMDDFSESFSVIGFRFSLVLSWDTCGFSPFEQVARPALA